MSTLVQGSWGVLIVLKHDFPYIAGDVGVIQYTNPRGGIGELVTVSFDAEEISAVIPEEFSTEKGLNWKFNVKVTGSRATGPFSIQSEVLDKTVQLGINDFS